MPIPQPAAGESKDTFLAACMADPTMTTEYTDAAQRYSVCLAQWEKDRSDKPITPSGSGWPTTPF